MHPITRRLSPSLVLAILALFVALGSTALAAGEIITSPDQVKDGVITGPKLAPDSVTTGTILDRQVKQHDEANPSLRARIAPSGLVLTGDVPDGTVQHVQGSGRYDVTLSAGDLGPLGLDTCAVTASPAFKGLSIANHDLLRAYVNHAPGSKNVQVFTYKERLADVNGRPDLVEVPTDAAFDLVLAC
jgi:hypothetical protein